MEKEHWVEKEHNMQWTKKKQKGKHKHEKEKENEYII